MEHFTKTLCIIDTCSIINLDEITLAQKDALEYLRRFFDVRVCDTIKDEFLRHRDLVVSREASYWGSFLSSRRYTPQVLIDDQAVLEPFYGNPPSFVGTDDAGERGNARVALELLLTRQAGHTIFITDDESACNAFLKALTGAFPGISLWSSADVVLYLGAILMKEGRADFESVRASLRDLYAAARIMRPWALRSPAERESLIRQQAISVKNLKLVTKVVTHWRN